MANRTFIDKQYTLAKGTVTLFARVLVTGTTPGLQKWQYAALGVAGSYVAAATTGGGTGFPTRFVQGAEGVFSVARTGAGLWTVTLQDFYTRLLLVTGHQTIAGGTANIITVTENSTITAMSTAANGGSVIGVGLLSSTGTAADPTSGSSMNLMLVLQNSTAP